MEEEYFAEGFRHVDRCADGAAYSLCLSLIDSLPYYRHIKRKSYDLLSLAPGISVLDVGCGVGDDIRRMAGLVAPGGIAVGIDVSTRMIGEAHSAQGDGAARFCLADGRRLPFPDRSFERCRADRTLQHIEAAPDAVREMARVLKPGGIFLAYDNDWGTFTLSGRNTGITRMMQDLWQNSFPNRWIGRYLPGLAREAGLRDVEIFPSVSIIEEFGLADRLYNLRQTAVRAVKGGVVSEREGAEWIQGLETASAEGRFFCSLSSFMVSARKP